jgi:hypothetical protein
VLTDATDRSSWSPLAQALDDLWQRTTALGDREHHAELADAIIAWLTTYVEEARWRRDDSFLSVERYLDHRKWASAWPVFLRVTALLTDPPLPAAALRDPVTAAMTRLAGQHICIVNDIFGADRELSRGDLGNLVLILEHRYGRTRPEAVNEALTMANATCRLYMRLELSRINDADQHSGPLTKLLRAWMRGNLDWHLETARYAQRGRFGGLEDPTQGQPAMNSANPDALGPQHPEATA